MRRLRRVRGESQDHFMRRRNESSNECFGFFVDSSNIVIYIIFMGGSVYLLWIMKIYLNIMCVSS